MGPLMFTLIFGLAHAAVDPGPRPIAPVLAIGIAGASGAGKTELAHAVAKYVDAGELVILPLDSYFRDWDKLPREHYVNGNPNGDHPSAIDLARATADLERLKRGERVRIPRYDFAANVSRDDGPTLGPARVVLVEGLHAAWAPRLRGLLDYVMFVSADADVRLARRLTRDEAERHQTMARSLAYYVEVVRPMQRQFVDPTVIFADRRVDGEDAKAAALEVAAEITRFIARVRKREAPFFYDREIAPLAADSALNRGESIQQRIIEQGGRATLVVGGSLRPPTRDHVGLMIQTMSRFGFVEGKFMPSNAYKPGSVNNAAALWLAREQVKHFDEALDADGVRYTDFTHAPRTGARWTGEDGRVRRVRVDSTEIDVAQPLVDGEDRRTLIAFERLRDLAGGDPKSVFWVAGGDSFTSLPTWNSRWREHLNLANWIVVTRPEFEGQERNVSFETTDPLATAMPEVAPDYAYHFDHATQTHVYENKDPSKPNIYVIRLSTLGYISSTSVRQSLAEPGGPGLVARAGLLPAVLRACLDLGVFKPGCQDKLTEGGETKCAP